MDELYFLLTTEITVKLAPEYIVEVFLSELALLPAKTPAPFILNRPASLFKFSIKILWAKRRCSTE